jgi:hypothetical protein
MAAACARGLQPGTGLLAAIAKAWPAIYRGIGTQAREPRPRAQPRARRPSFAGAARAEAA